MADFVSSTENDKIIGTDGDDHITLQGLRTVGDGGAGNDNILSSGYLSTLKGGAGDDLVELMSSYIVASGDAGNDTLIAEAMGRFVNIANVSMTGGEGADTFVLMPTYAKTVDADGNDVYNWKTVLSSNIMDFNIADGDQIILQNVGEGDYDEEADRVDPNTYNLYYGRDTNRDLRFYDYNGRVNFTFKGITRLSDVANAEIYYIDQSGIPLGRQYLSNAVPFATLSSGVRTLNNWLILSGADGGDLWINDTSYSVIDAVEDSVAGRALVGNERDNWIYAGDYGSKMWGRSGANYLVGGAGADTFFASQSESAVYIVNCGDDDIVKFQDITLEDLAGLSFDTSEGYGADGFGAYENLNITTKGGTLIQVARPDDAKTFTVQLADALTFRFNYDDQSWDFADRESIAPLEEPESTAGLMTFGDTVYITSSYEGDFRLSSLDDDSIANISAVNDTVSGRVLVGDEQDNRIYANNYGSSLYGNGGNDYLIGGNGADTFRAGMDEGQTRIVNYGNEDVIDLWNVDFADVDFVYTYNLTDSNLVCVQTDGATVDVVLDSDTDRTITFALADGSTMRHDSSANTWQRNTGSNWQTITEVNGTPIELRVSNGIVYVYPKYDGDFSLADLNDSSYVSLSGYYDDLNGRKLIGNDQSNRVRASATAGSWLWGGYGGDDTLVGGAGDDTFQAGQGEGSAQILDYESADLVYLHNINVEDVATLSVSTVDDTRAAFVGTSDGSSIEVYAALDEETINFRFADGSGMRYDVADDEWQSNSSGAWQALNDLNDLNDLTAAAHDDVDELTPILQVNEVAPDELDGAEALTNKIVGGSSLLAKYADFIRRKNS